MITLCNKQDESRNSSHSLLHEAFLFRSVLGVEIAFPEDNFQLKLLKGLNYNTANTIVKAYFRLSQNLFDEHASAWREVVRNTVVSIKHRWLHRMPGVRDIVWMNFTKLHFSASQIFTDVRLKWRTHKTVFWTRGVSIQTKTCHGTAV